MAELLALQKCLVFRDVHPVGSLKLVDEISHVLPKRPGGQAIGF